MKSKPAAIATVPKLWPGDTFVVLASGPSLTREDATYCQGKARVIAINTSYLLAPWADVIYACDAQWWRWDPLRVREKQPSVFACQGLKYTLATTTYPGVQTLANTGREGLELKPNGLRTGTNSGYQAINLAVHLGAVKIILLGYDMQAHGKLTHWHGDHPQKSTLPFVAYGHYFTKLAPVLKRMGIDVVNCSRRTALTCFRRARLEDALPQTLAVAS